ncbi:EAL domain-containing protein [Gellertiella hungarica]|uniref:Diguanylate cyclase (GGDEF)-like protein n=1 Tax=Gellertiella hungarica TaxID=1572859 RepID=A0A7W6J362_9HYPH|nr:diguanylate cyclase (GGDEF)-like protein [Gellertiella hungarica]
MRKTNARFVRLQAFMLFSVVALATLFALLFADQQRALYQEENSRNMVTEQLSVMRSAIEGRINGNVLLLKGLVAALQTEPKMTPERFDALARGTLATEGNIAFVSAAPEMVVTMVYPLSQSSRIGFDFRKRNREHGAAFLAAQSRKVNISGPVDLDNGGKGLVVNYPVLVERKGAKPDLWGILSATIDLGQLFQESGLMDEDLPIFFAISRGDAHGMFGKPFFGRDDVFSFDPVRMTVNIGQDYWLLAAAPKEGWGVGPAQLLPFRIFLLLAAAAILLPMLWVIRLMAERYRTMEHLERNGERLTALSSRLELALATSQVGIWEHDVHSGRQVWDDRVRGHLGMTEIRDYYEFADWKRVVHPDDVAAAEKAFADALAARSAYVGQYRIQIPGSSEVKHIRAFGRLVDSTPGRERFLGVEWDITADVRREEALLAAREMAEEKNRALEQAHRQMEFNALHDALTGLPNRRYLDQFLADLGPADGAPLSILHLDLDRFKDINDTLGHAAGDSILRHAASVIAACAGADDFVARFGGDEFVIVRRESRDTADLERLAGRIIAALTEPVFFEGQECRAGASIGIATWTREDESPGELLVNADIALYEAKKRGRGRVEFFTDGLRAQVVETKQTADDILRALEQGEFVAFFQPQFDARTRDIDGVEALVRWEHPERGLLAPDAFLRIAESLNVMHRIDEIVLDQALFHLRQWQAAGLAIPRVSVNISAQRLLEGGLLEKIEDLRFDPGSLCFELLESISFEDDDDAVLNTIERLKALGVDIEIDDFGTGHASIVNLLKLTPRKLKIDRQLITPILDSQRERQLVSSIIDIGRTCGIGIVAEGVETMDHAALLSDMGCQTLQGYAFARPMRAADFLAFALAHESRPENGRKRA